MIQACCALTIVSLLLMNTGNEDGGQWSDENFTCLLSCSEGASFLDLAYAPQVGKKSLALFSTSLVSLAWLYFSNTALERKSYGLEHESIKTWKSYFPSRLTIPAIR